MSNQSDTPGMGDIAQADPAVIATEEAAADPVAVLALQLGRLVKLERRVDEKDEEIDTVSPVKCKVFESALTDRHYATMEMISCLEATSLTGAAVQIMLAYDAANHLGTIEIKDEREIDPILRKLKRLLWSALPVVVRAAGLAPEDIGVRYFTGVNTSPFPPADLLGAS